MDKLHTDLASKLPGIICGWWQQVYIGESLRGPVVNKRYRNDRVYGVFIATDIFSWWS